LPLIFLRPELFYALAKSIRPENNASNFADVRIAEGLPEREQAAPSQLEKANMNVLMWLDFPMSVTQKPQISELFGASMPR
jgi:hypothetical protein